MNGFVPYPIQLKRKQEQVEELLAPLASINNVTIEPIRGMTAFGVSLKAATPFAPGRLCTVRPRGQAVLQDAIASKECLVEDGRAAQPSLIVAHYQEDRAREHFLPWRGSLSGVICHQRRVMLVLAVNGQHLPHEQEFIAALRKARPDDQHLLERQPEAHQRNLRARNLSALNNGERCFGPHARRAQTSFYQTNSQQTEVPSAGHRRRARLAPRVLGATQDGAALTSAPAQAAPLLKPTTMSSRRLLVAQEPLDLLAKRRTKNEHKIR